MVNLLTLIDDIAATMDDVAIMTKVALKKTSALMTDDLAVNAAVVHGVEASRELPIVWSIFLGSLVNKVISISIVLLLGYLYPFALTILLFLGGCYLAFEGTEKVLHKLRKKSDTKKEVQKPNEKQKIWGAIKTDFVLSMEIIVLAQTSLTGTLLQQTLSLTIVGLLASFLIYGLVAILVKVDDLGVILVSKGHKSIGLGLIDITPKMMKGLGAIGTLAMLMVAGGIFSHTFHFKFYINEHIQNLLIGFFTGTILVLLITGFKFMINPQITRK